MNLGERGIAVGKYALKLPLKVVGIDAAWESRKFQTNSRLRKAVEIAKSGFTQLAFAQTSKKVFPFDGESFSDKIDIKIKEGGEGRLCPFAFTLDTVILGVTVATTILDYRLVLGLLGYNTLTQIAPDVVNLIARVVTFKKDKPPISALGPQDKGLDIV